MAVCKYKCVFHSQGSAGRPSSLTLCSEPLSPLYVPLHATKYVYDCSHTFVLAGQPSSTSCSQQLLTMHAAANC
eukprot:1161782-Pelagomonas_calceolata.AAC.12